jgi:hypothetical protein
MQPMIAYCGLVCTECQGYLATQANDLAALERQAERARMEWGVPGATAESVKCDGCLSASGRKIGYCAECAIRACGTARGVANCAACPDYACEKLTGFLAMAPKARATLEGLRAGLPA